MATCDVAQLLQNASPYLGLTPPQLRVTQAQLLCEIFANLDADASDCDIDALLAASNRWMGLTPPQLEWIETQLLCDIAGISEGTCTPGDLTIDGCLQCLHGPQLEAIKAQLLCQIVNGGGVSPPYTPPAVFGTFPNDSFEDYTSGQDLLGRNGGENGNVGFTILWESAWVSEPWLGLTGDPALDPDDISGLQVWVKADQLVLNNNDLVATWADQSGNARNFTAAGGQRPTYQTNIQNGLPGVFFSNTAGVGMTGAYNKGSGDFTVMIVLKCNGTALANRRAIQGTAGNWRIGLFGAFLLPQNTSQEIAYQQNSTVCHVLIITQTATGTLTQVFVDGGEAAQRTGAQVWPGVISLGATGFANEPADAWIFEVAIYDKVLTESEAYGLSMAMINKWGI